MTNYVTVLYSLLLFSSAIAFTQATAIAHPSPLQNRKSSQQHLVRPFFMGDNPQPSFLNQAVMRAKPGMPRRRVGGGSRLY